MPDNVTGLGRLSWLPAQDPTKPIMPKDQTKAYFDGVKTALGEDKYSSNSGKDYTDTKGADNGLANQTIQSDEFSSESQYIDFLNKNGSQILTVDGKQVGNMKVAQINDDTTVNAYYKHPKP